MCVFFKNYYQAFFIWSNSNKYFSRYNNCIFSVWSCPYLYYADRVYQINLAIAGIAVGTVSLPVLSKAFKSKNYSKVSNIQNKAIQLSLLLSIPASLGLIIASEEIINGLFGYGSFSSEDVKMTSGALMFFGYGIIAFALVKILSNFFLQEIILKYHFISRHLQYF